MRHLARGRWTAISSQRRRANVSTQYMLSGTAPSLAAQQLPGAAALPTSDVLEATSSPAASGNPMVSSSSSTLSSATAAASQTSAAPSSASANLPPSTPTAGAASPSAPRRKATHIAASAVWHNPSAAPSPPTLSAARAFFTRGPRASPLFSAAALHQVPRDTGLPEVAFVGRSNVGKSTLLNAVLASGALCRTSSKPGRTRLLHAYACGPDRPPTDHRGFIVGTAVKNANKPTAGNPANSNPNTTASKTVTTGGAAAGVRRLAVVDMPGYGAGSRAEWGAGVLGYVTRRRQLRRVFVVVDALHGVKPTDAAMLAQLRGAGVPAQVVLSKVDRLLDAHPERKAGLAEDDLRAGAARLRAAVEDARAAARPPGAVGVLPLEDVICVGAAPGRRLKALAAEPAGVVNVDGLRAAIVQAAGFDLSAPRWAPPADVLVDESL